MGRAVRVGVLELEGDLAIETVGVGVGEMEVEGEGEREGVLWVLPLTNGVQER